MTRTPTKNSETWKAYSRKGTTEMRPYVKGEDLTGVSVSDADDPESDMGMIARNPDNHSDQWYVARRWFDDNYTIAPERGDGQETGIDWWALGVTRKDVPPLPKNMLSDDFESLCEWAAQIALSRQSVNDEDWEKKLAEAKRAASKLSSAQSAAYDLHLSAREILRRALRATRTPEGEAASYTCPDCEGEGYAAPFMECRTCMGEGSVDWNPNRTPPPTTEINHE